MKIFEEKKYMILTILSLTIFLASCSVERNLFSQFSTYKGNISEIPIAFENDELGKIEDIDCYGSTLVTFDHQDGYLFSVFNAETGKFVRRFGKLGHGENEISLGTWGNLWKDSYYAFNFQTENIYKYSHLQSEELKIERTRYNLADNNNVHLTYFTKLAPVNENLFLGKGIYNDKYHYALFDRNSVVKDSLKILDDQSGFASDPAHKMLTNQGPMIRCSDRDIFVSAVYNSSDIDFIEVKDGKMKLLKSYSDDDLMLNPTQYDGQMVATPTNETITGFLDLAGTDRYVFALYSDKLRKENTYPFRGRDILVYDWTGKKVFRLPMKTDICDIAASGDRLYTLQLEDGEFAIKCYSIEF